MKRLMVISAFFAVFLAFSVAQAQERGVEIHPPLQFESVRPHETYVPQMTIDPAAPPGIAWLQKTPSTLFDMGMMELTRTANKAAEGLFDVSGAVANYREGVGKISINFYAGTEYSPQNCEYIARKMRAEMFPLFEDKDKTAKILGSYFIGFGPMEKDRPSTIGQELLDGLSFVVFLPGGACELPIGGERLFFLADPDYKPVRVDPKAEQQMPQVPDVTKLLGEVVGKMQQSGTLPPSVEAKEEKK